MNRIDVEKFAEENPVSRFRLHDTPKLPPGVCVICNSHGGDDRQFVETGTGLDFYGVFYFCTVCVDEIAKLLGYELKSNWTLAEQNLQDEISAGDDRFVESQERLRAARILLRNCHCSDIDSDLSVTPTVSMDDETDSEAESDVDNDDEPDGVEGSDDISESSDDAELDAESSSPSPRRRARKSAE